MSRRLQNFLMFTCLLSLTGQTCILEFYLSIVKYLHLESRSDALTFTVDNIFVKQFHRLSIYQKHKQKVSEMLHV